MKATAPLIQLTQVEKRFGMAALASQHLDATSRRATAAISIASGLPRNVSRYPVASMRKFWSRRGREKA